MFLSVFSFCGCTFLFFYPERGLLENPLLVDFSFENHYFTSIDGVTLHGWLIKGKINFGTILFMHGNAENISTHINSVLWLAGEGYNIFAFDYRGYGLSEGVPTIDGVHNDALAALEFVVSLQNSNTTPIFILGQSLGGAISIYTVAITNHKNRISALIVDSAFSDYRVIAREKLSEFFLTYLFRYPISLLVDNYYSPVNWIRMVNPVPILIIHGDKDKIVPPSHSLNLYEKAEFPKDLWIIDGVGHISAFSREDVRRQLIQYLSRFSGNQR